MEWGGGCLDRRGCSGKFWGWKRWWGFGDEVSILWRVVEVVG